MPEVYKPNPIPTATVNLDKDLLDLIEILAQHAHDVWAAQRISEGWSYDRKRNERSKVTPLLVPYHDLPESDKEVDRNMVIETLRAVMALGYEITRSVRQRPDSG